MKKLTLVEAFNAMERWNKLSVEAQIALLDPVDKSYMVQIISANPDEFITFEYMLNNRFCVNSNLVGVWELSVSSATWYSCIDPMQGEDSPVKYIRDASHFKRYTSIEAKL